MRQVQELSITLSLSAISITLLCLATLLGAFSVWRDIERRYTAAVLGLPVSRASYLLGKFFGNTIVIVICALLLGGVSLAIIHFTAAQSPSEIKIIWFNIVAAIVADTLKYILLAALALFFSSFSTSFFLPIFGTVSMYFAGNASQDVFEYVSGDYGRSIPLLFKQCIKGVYYLLPNFSAFNLKVQAIYALPLPLDGLLLLFLYFFIYTAIIIYLAVWIFTRRELP
jgi:ABC-type transport system involved in multi-copper enzyme maturation permease subunit